MRPVAILLSVVALLAAACSGSAADPPGPAPAATGTTTAPVATTQSQPTPAPTVPATSPSTTTAETTGTPEVRPAGIGDEYYPLLGNPGYDVQHYDLDLVFDPVENHLSATATITAVATIAFSDFNLDFDRLTVEAVRVDAAPATFAHADEELTIRPAEEIREGAEFVVEVDYSGMPGPEPTAALPGPVGWFTSSDGSEAFVIAEPDLAHTWFPANDHPQDKATFTFEITVPDGLIAAANGTLISTTPGAEDTATWLWRMDDSMATYLATVVIGEFDIVPDDAASRAAGFPVRHVLPRGTTVADWPGLERQGEMLAFFEEAFGPYPFDTYGIAVVDGFRNALENQTLSIFGRRFTDPQIFERVLVHETAHQWFGNSVSVGMWRDIWLNEGFASYAEWLWLERERGRELLESSIETERSFFAENGARPPGDPLSTDLFNQSVYRIGAMTLHALRLTVGDGAFFEILRTYHRQFAGGTATTDDFVAVAESVSGMDLEDLFAAWLFGPQVPQFPTGSAQMPVRRLVIADMPSPVDAASPEGSS